MRAAKPGELKSHAVPVMTAKVSEHELTEWFPFAFEDITDSEATPEPSKGALVKLTNGQYFVVYWGESSHQLTLQIPQATDPLKFLAAFFTEVPLPRSRIVWRRADARLPARPLSIERAATSLRMRSRKGTRTAATVARGARGVASRRLSARKK
jgi:hypothetical protein